MNKTVKKSSTKKKSKIKMLMGFPHIWVSIIILFLMIISIITSIILEQHKYSYAASICANIFAGLLTGLIICLISGIKQLTIIKMNAKKNWLTHIRKMIFDFDTSYRELIKKSFDKYDGSEELFNFIYDVGAKANWVNEDIMQSTFNRTLSFDPYNYCCKTYNYDAVVLAKDFQLLHGNLYMVDIDNPSKKEIIHYFEAVNTNLRQLTMSISQDLDDIEIRIKEITTSVL